MLMAEWNLSQLLFADDMALVADSERKLRKLVEYFGRVLRGEKSMEVRAK